MLEEHSLLLEFQIDLQCHVSKWQDYDFMVVILNLWQKNIENNVWPTENNAWYFLYVTSSYTIFLVRLKLELNEKNAELSVN